MLFIYPYKSVVGVENQNEENGHVEGNQNEENGRVEENQNEENGHVEENQNENKLRKKI